MRAPGLLVAVLLATCPTAGAAVSADDVAMAAGHAHDVPVATAAATTEPAVPVVGETVTYGTIDGRDLKGYVARPVGAKPGLPGLIVIHEWWGLNDNVRAETRRLAAEGYVALAVDLYAGRVATAPPDAMRLSRELTSNASPAEANLRAAHDYLERIERAPRIGSIGWCLGGRWSLRTALLLPAALDATVIYYGSVTVPEAELATLEMPILGLFAGRDRVVPLPTVSAFREMLQRLGKKADIRVYESADHAFANPSGLAYDAAAADDAWRLTTAFLREHLVR
jgi:carboxymethylenebutenolidase